MSDYPERISISPTFRQKREDDFYLVDRKAFPGKGTEYVRADRIKALEALLSEAVKAGMIEGANVAKRMSDWDEMSDQWRNGCFSICADLRVKSENPETIARIVAQLKEGRG